MIVTQIGIALFGVTAVWLSQDERDSRRRWAPVFGLAGQPFWLIETIQHQQWGMVALCALYTLSWAKGLRGYWLTGRAA